MCPDHPHYIVATYVTNVSLKRRYLTQDLLLIRHTLRLRVQSLFHTLQEIFQEPHFPTSPDVTCHSLDLTSKAKQCAQPTLLFSQ